MLGWEFSPFISGGLGTACYGLTRGLDRLGVSVLFVLPQAVEGTEATHVNILSPSVSTDADLPENVFEPTRAAVSDSGETPPDFQRVEFHAVEAALRPYESAPLPTDAPLSAGAADPSETVLSVSMDSEPTAGGPVDSDGAAQPREQGPDAGPVDVSTAAGPGRHYGGDLFSEVERYARSAYGIARRSEFDVIHAHDWMTFPAGMAVANLSGKPLVVHVHSTEFDRSGLHVNQRVYDIERAGMHAAARVICVSYLTRNMVVGRYGVDPRRVEVVYNAIDDNGPARRNLPAIAKDEKIVLFLGRITMQKGPEYFLAAAKRVLGIMDNVRFIMAGSGDMIRRTIELAAEMGIGHKVLFTGFLRGDDVRRVFRMADLYVMPSVSEPFGITPLEALSNDVPVLISKQSGVAEVLTHALKVDFWDIDEMANKIVAVLRHPPLHATLRDHGGIEVQSFSWNDAAAACVKVYKLALG